MDFLIMEDEHLDTIPETESDELIKSSVEDLVQIPSESEDSSKGECDLPPYDDSSKNHDLTFSNPLFDIDEDFTSSDESFSEEDVPNENFKIFSNPLFDLDKEITSTKVDQVDDDVLENTNSIPQGIEYPCFSAESDLLESLLHRDTSINDSQKIDSLLDEFADILFLERLLYDNSSPRPPEEFNSENPTESFSPSPILNYNMHSLGKTVNELHAMLKLHGQTLTLSKNNVPALHAIRAGKVQKVGALSLYVDNGQREAVKAIDNFDLSLPSGLVIVLNNYHYAPSITRGVILVSRLYEDGFINRFVNNTIQVSRNNMVYFSAIPRGGIFEIDLSNSYANECYIYTVSNKRAKLDLDSALLWHCRLGHISKKRIEKLQHDGLLNSTDLKAFEKCVPCMFGKMARKPYTHLVETAKDLLGLIHTDVCGLFKIMSRQGASYFVTFTDDFSRYGYVVRKIVSEYNTPQMQISTKCP
ncbi:retrotransposon protein, putative, ty1-copia subclass [Tanacetum coccineum]